MTTLDDILDSPRTRRPMVMGIVNLTPDSFSDGGRFASPAAAVEEARRMIDQGADVIDLGAESTRPGSLRVGADEQIARLRDVLPAVTATGAAVSVDTTLAPVAAFATEHGAALINDISAGRDDPTMLPLAASRRTGLVLMHMLGQPATMQHAPHYDDVVADVRAFLLERIAAARQAGVEAGRIILDPGIGFGKTAEHNLTLLANVAEFAKLGLPVLIGASRKRFLGEVTAATRHIHGMATPCPADRVPGTIAAHVAAYLAGATIFRVHDVPSARASLDLAAAVRRQRENAGTRRCGEGQS